VDGEARADRNTWLRAIRQLPQRPDLSCTLLAHPTSASSASLLFHKNARPVVDCLEASSSSSASGSGSKFTF
jgi:hypothetical protein